MIWTTDRTSKKSLIHWACLLLILAVGLYLRLGTAAWTRVNVPVRNDAKQYVAHAWNLKFHGVYSGNPQGLVGNDAVHPRPDAGRTPGYPLFLDLFVHRRIGGRFIANTKYVQAWIAEATLLFSVLLAVELLGPWAGLGLGALVALSPHQSIYIAYLLTETLYGLIVVLALWTAVLALKAGQARRRRILASLTGVLFGLSCLVRPTLNQWVPVLVVLMLVWPALRRFRRDILLMAFGFVLAMSPWWGRNLVTLHELSSSTRMRVTLQQGGYPDFMYRGLPQSYGYPYDFDPKASEAAASWKGVVSDLAGKFRREPWTMLRWYVFGKITYFFGWSPPDGWRGMFTYPVLKSPWLSAPAFVAATSLIYTLYVPLIVLGVLGMLIAFLPRTRTLFGEPVTRGIRFLALFHLFVIGVHVAGAPFARYSVPFRPLTFLLAVFVMVWAVRFYQASKALASASSEAVPEVPGAGIPALAQGAGTADAKDPGTS